MFKSRCLIIIYAFFLVQIGNAQEAQFSFLGNEYIVNPVVSIRFEPDQIVIIDEKDDGHVIKEVVRAKYEHSSKLSYLSVFDDIEHSPHSFFLKKGRYLILASSSFLFLYADDNLKPVLVCSNRNTWYPGSNKDYLISYSSCLKENNIEYDVTQFNDYMIGKPWVEGKANDGVGEYIAFGSTTKPTNGYVIAILNGYISFKKPYLFEQNNRVKVLEIEDGTDTIKEVVLPDSPNPFYIVLDTKSEKIRYRIKDVYKGSKYNDTCISLIAPIEY